MAQLSGAARVLCDHVNSRQNPSTSRTRWTTSQMTHKFGRIERRIRGIVASEPPNAFTVRELCERIYEVPPEKKHRVAVLRAMKTMSGCWPHMGLITRPGVGAVIYDQRSEVSHRVALAKLG